MKNISYLLFVTGLILLFSCDKITPFTIDVSVITTTDTLGNIIGPVDNTDWTQDASWSETEKSFFRADPIDMSAASVATINLQPAYPNPTTQKGITLQFTSSAVTFLRIAIVDASLNKLAYYTFLTTSGINAYFIPLNGPSFVSNKNYRIYYSFDAPPSPMYYKGHGDVTIKD